MSCNSNSNICNAHEFTKIESNFLLFLNCTLECFSAFCVLKLQRVYVQRYNEVFTVCAFQQQQDTQFTVYFVGSCPCVVLFILLYNLVSLRSFLVFDISVWEFFQQCSVQFSSPELLVLDSRIYSLCILTL